MRWVGAVAAPLALAGAVWAQSALQLTPDGRHTLISKRVGGEEWAIALNDEDKTVSGNVLNDQGLAQFLFCEPELSLAPDEAALSCKGAPPCTTSPCDPAAWTPAGDVTLPLSFFRPPAGPTPTPVPTSALTALRGRWTFTWDAEEPAVASYDLEELAYQFGTPVLIGVDASGAAVTAAYYEDLSQGGVPPWEFAMLAPGSPTCLLYLFDHTATDVITGITYVNGTAPDGTCLRVALGQTAYDLRGERLPAADAASRATADAETAAALGRIGALLERPTR